MFAVLNYNIRSITHKFMITGHTQNEADNGHSLIEKQIKRNLKSGPIYTPEQYVTLIKNSRKTGKPFMVHELSCESFYNLKNLQEEWGSNFSKNKSGNVVKWNNIKVTKVEKNKPSSFFYKESHNAENYEEVVVRSFKAKKLKPLETLNLQPAYLQIIPLSEHKKLI
uniref:Uncharacterized protein LOC114324186 n=1 Tax=Diabrotica virgifera virgifera TaxID=50390 RepID=A0A6P7F1D5_DIAVI